MRQDRIELTRRKLLAGVSAVGAAGIGAGLGTSALFSDEESFEDNRITAGTLDMSVTATVEGANEYWEERVEGEADDNLVIDGLSTTADGGAVTGLSVTDVKPGDWAIVCFDVDIGENPGYVQVSTSALDSSENGYTEPEPEDDTPNEGELEDEMIAELYGTLKGIQPSNSANTPYSYVRNNSLHPALSRPSTVQDTYDALSAGAILPDENGDPAVVGSGDEAATWCLLLHLPRDVGNVVQSDGFTVDLAFHAEQARNNDDPFADDDSGGGTTAQSVDLTASGGTHDFDITVGSEDDGEALTEIQVDYGADGPAAGTPTAFGTTLLLNGTDVSGDFTGVAGDNGGERLTWTLGGNYTISAGDQLDLAFDFIPSASSGTADVSINGDGVDTASWGSP
jgi:predicted ribosomally synthesized peptide with SipW-like signal peptide